MKLNNKTAKIMKKNFPIFKNNPGLVYLDNAATSHKPQKVIDTISEFYEKYNANIERGVYNLAEKVGAKYNESRKVVANFINADEKEIVFTRNSTESLNLLSYTLPKLIPKEKNEILLTDMEHHSNFVPWQQMVKRHNFKLKFVKIKPDFSLDYEDLKNKLTDRTAIFSFTYVSNVLGTINNVKLLTKLAKQKGAITIIDAAQAAAHLKLNVKKINCDFLVFSSHKMLGPIGIGVLYGRKELLEKLPPFNFGGGMIKKVSFESTEFKEAPYKFEAGTQNIAEAIGLAEAIKYIQKIGIKDINKWEKELVKYAVSKLKQVKGVKLYNSKNSTSIISFTLNKIHPHDVATLLDEKKIAIRAGYQCAMPLMSVLGLSSGVCRISFSIYNTFEDIDFLIGALKGINQKFKINQK